MGYVRTTEPIQQMGFGTNHGDEDIGTILTLKPRVNQETRAWMNDFIFLEQNETDVDIHYSLNDPMNTQQTPYFSDFITVHKSDSLVCFDADFVTETTIIVDCTTALAGIANGFIFVDLKTGEKHIQNNDNPHNYNKTKARKIATLNYTAKSSEYDQVAAPAQSFLFRGEPAWATENNTQDKLDTDCELEVFLLNPKSEEDQKYVAMLNTTILKTLLPEPVDKFSLIDFQVEPNGELYVLDAFNGVYVLKLTNANQFQLRQHFENPSKEQIYAFDFNYLSNPDGSYTQHLVLAYKNKVVVYENFNQKFTFQLPHPAVYGELRLSMSQQFLVIVQKQGTYLYHIEETMLLFKNEDYFEQVLVNPYYPDMVGINQQRAYRYELSKGYLTMYSKKEPTPTQVQFNLNSWPQNGGKMCSVLMKLTILPENDTNIYRTSNDPFPDEMVYPSKSIVVDLLASGPSLMYKQLANNSHVDLTLDSMWEVFVKGVDLPEAKDVVYADLLVLDRGDRVYFLFQTPDQNCTMIRCINQDIKNTTLQKCGKIDEFHVPFILNKTKNSFTWWQNFNMVTYVYQETDFVIKVFTSTGQSSQTGEIAFDAKDQGNKINSFVYLQNAVFVVQSAKYQISVWTVRGDIVEIYKITQGVLRDQGYNGTFIPKAVFGNPKIRGQVVFIQTQEEILIGEFANGNDIHVFHLMEIIPIIPKSEVSIAIGPLTFTIVQKTASEQILEEYNWEHLQLISLNKRLPLYQYQLQEPLNIDYCSQSGWLFVRAIDTKIQETVILVYEPNVLSHVSLHKVIKTGYKINDVFDMAVDGDKQMFIYFNDNKVNKFVTLLQDAVLTILPKEEVLQYVNKLETSVEISSALGGTAIVINEKIKLMNTDSKIVVKQSSLDKYRYMFQFKKNDNDQILDLKSDWYVGQPYDLFILCDQCGDQIVIQPQIVKSSSGTDMKYVIYDGTQFDSDTLVYQADKSLIFQHKNGSFLNRISLDQSLGQDQRCELLTVTKDSKHIISTVIGTGDVSVLVNECTGTKCKQFEQGEVQLAGVTQAIKMRFVFGRNFIVLNTDPVSYSKFESSIIVYSFNTTGTTFTILSQKVINTKYLGPTSQVQIADFCHLTVSESIYAILLTDITRGVWIVNLGSNVDGSVTELNKELINLKGYEHEQYYLKDDTHFHQLKILSQEQSDKIFKIQLLVTTSNVANYIFYFELEISSKTGASYIKQSLKLQQVLFNYGDWKSANKMSFAANHVSVAYTDGNEVVLAVYYIEVKKLDEVKSVPFIYGIRADYNSPLPADFAMIVSQYQNQTYLYANIEYDSQFSEHTVFRYSIYDNPKLILKNCSTLKEQSMEIYAANHFGSSSGKTYLWDSDNVPDDDDSSSSKWWWITLIIIFGVAILGVGGFFLYKKFGKKGVEPLLG
ncbi:unnamed protein product (macronuclear) [Paramecium tetraurelia]|uniref:Cleavage/polyadenylation specificity factor A subunit C-terminal domain-containing protein n=1 Tax=Paramecium tetraurelia TaxID=5888 RepID=A0CCY8_PARTE|nr:uncharacterized protein GSPATT00037440001 [Paramecium tetraurelia]CAK68655.1 unnamed protein product [Paramecium tetraurelia]|eukprot:XP_001436052.1 hypothetical protein (macronuclear) [Paramecium tetraurelia strain d4-2]